MTEDEALELAGGAHAERALARFAEVDEPTRRKASKQVLALWKDVWRAQFSIGSKAAKMPKIKDQEALRIAMLATAVPSELKPYGFHCLPERLDIVEVMRALKPSWLDRYVADFVDDWPHITWRLAPLWRGGLCARPEGDGLIIAYYSGMSGPRLAEEEPNFLTHDIWRFFEVEGGGEFSLAAIDKYTPVEHQWSTELVGLSREGKLDRARLLDASLDALERDFGQFRVGWYARFHTALEPSIDEMAARTARYLRLLSSPIPPTVSFALRALKALDKAGALDSEALLCEIEPALQARQKAAAKQALDLVALAAKRAPEHARAAARLAASALINEAVEIQTKALDLIERLGCVDDDEVNATLTAHLDAVAPSLRPRLAAMTGETAPEVAPTPTAEHQEPGEAAPVTPVSGLDNAIALFLEVLESGRDPIAVERAMDGLARFGAAARKAPTKLSPIAKRARQLLERGNDSATRLVLAATGVAIVEGERIETVMARHYPEESYRGVSRRSFAAVFLRRNEEVLAAVRDGRSAPLLSLPTDQTATVAPSALVERVLAHREAASDLPEQDLALALLRLGRTGREEAVACLDPRTEAERAVAYALGKHLTPEKTASLWVAAWAARAPETPVEEIRRLAGGPIAGAGTPAQLTVQVKREGSEPYFWGATAIEVAPPPVRANEQFLPSFFHLPHEDRFDSANPCGWTFEDIAWSSIVWPGVMEPFFAHAIPAVDTDQKLTDHFALAYLEPLFRPGVSCGPMGAAMLGYYLASADSAITSMAVEAIAALIDRQELTPDALAEQTWPFITAGTWPLKRWVRGFGTIAALSEKHAGFIRVLITRLLRFDAGDIPRDLGAMLELLYELHCESGTAFDDPAGLAFLERLDAGGKTRTYARKLRALGTAPAGSAGARRSRRPATRPRT